MLGDVNISAILDSFSVSYDKRVRPNYGGEYGIVNTSHVVYLWSEGLASAVDPMCRAGLGADESWAREKTSRCPPQPSRAATWPYAVVRCDVIMTTLVVAEKSEVKICAWCADTGSTARAESAGWGFTDRCSGLGVA